MLSPSQKIRMRFREQIRQRSIQQLMKITRQSLFHPQRTSSIFSQLDSIVKEASNQKTCMEIVGKLSSLLDSHAQHQNTYIIIGNYIIDHPSACQYLVMRLLSLSGVGKKKENYRRALKLVLLKSQQIEEDMLKQYDYTISQILSSAGTLQELRQGIDILKLILGLEKITEQKKFLPKESLLTLFNSISSYQINTLDHNLKYSLVDIGFYLGQYHLQSKFFNFETLSHYITILHLAISEFPAFRSVYFIFLKQICFYYDSFIDNILKTDQGRLLCQELFYLHQSCYMHRLVILEIFQYLLAQCQLDNILNLLNKGIHLTLVETFKGDPTPDQIQKALKSISLLLGRLSEKQEESLVDQILNSMEDNNFETYLKQLTNKRQSEETQKILFQLIDDYYSDDVQCSI